MPRKTRLRKNRASSKASRSRGGSRGNDSIAVSQRNVPLTVPKGVFIVPDRMMTELTFWGVKNVTIPTITGFVAVRYRPSGAQDLDPLVGATTTPGFAEFATLYGSYRVFESSMKVITANSSNTTTCTSLLVPLNNDPGAAPSLATVTAWGGNPYSRRKLVPFLGGPNATVNNHMTTERIYGSKMIYFDDNFSSPVTTIPANNWYWALGWIANAPPAANVTLVVEVTLKIKVEFYSRPVLLT